MTAAPRSLLDRRLLVVTGKGGVGKSTVAAALAWLGAARGKRVLACELDAKGDLLASLEGAATGRDRAPLAYEPREVHAGLWAMAMDPEASLREYLRLNLRIPFVTRVGPLSAALDFVASAAPGVREIVTIGKVAWEVRERRYDLVVVDATASGHVIGHLRAPQAINELVGVGLIRSQTGWMLDLLGDPATTGLVVVSTAEEMPVNETIELVDQVRADTVVDLGAVVANRVLPQPFTRADEESFLAMAAPDGRPAVTDLLAGALGARVATPAAVDALLDGVLLATRLRRARAEHLDRLLTTIGDRAEIGVVPQLFDVEPGLDTTRAVADHLAEELGL